MRPKNQKPPICIGGLEKLRAMDRPRYMNQPYPAMRCKRGRCREAIGMGFAHHCVYLSFYSDMISRKFVNTQKWWPLVGLLPIRELVAIGAFTDIYPLHSIRAVRDPRQNVNYGQALSHEARMSLEVTNISTSWKCDGRT